MTHPTHTAPGRPADGSPDAPFTAQLTLLRGQDAEVLTLRGELADSSTDLRRALARAEAAEAERDAATQAQSDLRCENSALVRDREILREMLARTVAAVMHGAPDPLAEALDLLDSLGVLVPSFPSRRRLAVAA